MNVPPQPARILPPDRLSSWALAGAGAGLLAAVPALPSAVRGLLLLAFILIGPGSVVVDWVPPLPTSAARALVPVTGFSVVTIVISLTLLLGFWSPRICLLALAVATIGGALANRRRDEITERPSVPEAVT